MRVNLPFLGLLGFLPSGLLLCDSRCKSIIKDPSDAMDQSTFMLSICSLLEAMPT